MLATKLLFPELRNCKDTTAYNFNSVYVILFPFEWREPFLMGPYLDTYFNYQLNHTPIPFMRNFVDKKVENTIFGRMTNSFIMTDIVSLELI